MVRKNLVIAILATFCLIATLFSVVPTMNVIATLTGYSPTPGQYNPWYDITGDGKIDGRDITALAKDFGKTGTALNTSAIYTGLDWGLLANWRFNEGTGTVATDSTGNGYDGALDGPTWTNGVYGRGLSFDGTDDYIFIPDIPVDEFGPPIFFSVAAWINGPLTDNGETIISNARGAFSMELPDRPGSFGVVRFGVDIGGSYYFAEGTTSPNNWHQIVGTYDGAAGTVKLYIDGLLVNQTATPSMQLLTNIPLPDLALIGSATNFGDFFKGTMSNVMIYFKTLPPEQVMALYLLPPP